jgi:hypothetical protein
VHLTQLKVTKRERKRHKKQSQAKSKQRQQLAELKKNNAKLQRLLNIAESHQGEGGESEADFIKENDAKEDPSKVEFFTKVCEASILELSILLSFCC